MKKHTKDDFITKAKEIHGDKYDYSKVVYKNSKTKVTILCKECGNEFEMKPNNHLNGQNCPNCVKNNFADFFRKRNTEDFKQLYFSKFGKRYDLSKVDYVNNRTKVCVICHETDENNKEHGEFYATPNSLLFGHGCPKCYNMRRNRTTKHTTEEWIKMAKRIHGDRYSYTKVNYENSHTKVCIICNKCGREFFQMPYDHLNGKGCNHCKESKLEKLTRNTLLKYNIDFIEQHTFDWLKTDNGTHQYLDFFLTENGIAIECQGEQHFKPVDFGNNGIDYAEKQFKETLVRDENKFKLCEKNNINVVYINYYDTTEDITNKIVNLNYGLDRTNSKRNK